MIIQYKIDDKELELPQVIAKGDAIDLRVADPITLKTGEYITANLGIAMKLPKGFVAVVLPRSSTFKNFGVIVPNSIGFIDNSYNGNEDIWKCPLYATRDTTIDKNIRVVQFTIMPSQFATLFQKLRWLFSSTIKLQRVNNLSSNSRGGIGSTGL